MTKSRMLNRARFALVLRANQRAHVHALDRQRPRSPSFVARCLRGCVIGFVVGWAGGFLRLPTPIILILTGALMVSDWSRSKS